MIDIAVLINCISKLIMIHIFWYWRHIFIDFVLSGSNESFSNHNFFHCFLNAFLRHYLLTSISLIYCKSHCLNLFGLRFASSKIFWKASAIVIPSLCFKKYLMHIYYKYQKTHNKNRSPWLSLLINCISGRSSPQILSIEDEFIFYFSNFVWFLF